MKTNVFRLILLCLSGALPYATAGASAPAATLKVSFEDVTKFTDFVLHHLSGEKTQEMFERQLERYWNARLGRLIPSGHTLELHFTDIDMAGKMWPARSPGRPELRYMEEAHPPRLVFSYRLLDEGGEVVAEGEENIRDTRYRRRPGSGGEIRHQYAFAYEFEVLRRWARDTF
ncbi:MAG: DUF3016 domain-containing protein [Opitutales bacterium]|nr:DUF3016 domain-containing protein [Opitutales bacterium]